MRTHDKDKFKKTEEGQRTETKTNRKVETMNEGGVEGRKYSSKH
jgi:hypothetical protein